MVRMLSRVQLLNSTMHSTAFLNQDLSALKHLWATELVSLQRTVKWTALRITTGVPHPGLSPLPITTRRFQPIKPFQIGTKTGVRGVKASLQEFCFKAVVLKTTKGSENQPLPVLLPKGEGQQTPSAEAQTDTHIKSCRRRSAEVNNREGTGKKAPAIQSLDYSEESFIQ